MNSTQPHDSADSSGSPYEKTLAFFIINATISVLIYLAYCIVLKFKLHNRDNDVDQRLTSKQPTSRLLSSSTKPSLSSDVLVAIGESQENLEHERWRGISDVLLIASTAFLWYSISLSFTIYNKWILQVLFGGFHFPMLQTMIHMIIKFLFSRLYVKLFLKSEDIPEISSSLFWKVILPIGITTSFDIAFSNEAIDSISISLYTILKTTVVIWTFLWGCLFDVEIFSLPKLICVFLVIVGLAVTVLDDLNSSMSGIVYCLAAAISGGLRWVMVQLLCESDASSRHPVVSMYRFSGSTVAAILPLALIVELKDFLKSSVIEHSYEVYEVAGLIIIGGIIACLLMVVEIYLLTLTSSLTLSILGEMKEVVQILFAVVVFHEHLSVQTCLGLLVVILSAELYRHLRKTVSESSNAIEHGRGGIKFKFQNNLGGSDCKAKIQIRRGHMYHAVQGNNDASDINDSYDNDNDKEFELGNMSNMDLMKTSPN